MTKKLKKALAVILALCTLFAMAPSVLAAECQSAEPPAQGGQIVFSGVSRLGLHETLSYTVTAADGSEAVVGIERTDTYARAGGTSWRGWYKGINTSAEFYMTVTNNKVTSVSNYSITIIGGSYEDASLDKTPTYGILTFTAKSLAGIITTTCWLKGEVTGEDDEINVTWQM